MPFKRSNFPQIIASASLFALLFLVNACQNQPDQSEISPDSSGPKSANFTLIPSSESGLDFRNDLRYDRAFNIYSYRNFYNGGGVGLGDINNDGLIDVFFTSNMGKNRLFLNRGGLKFDDISEKAGIGGNASWSTGVAMVDVNGDGWLDIYVCNSGRPRADEKGENVPVFNRENELFINNGPNSSSSGGGWGGVTFSEKAREIGLADPGLTTHAAFFDYDKDGDLDCYVLNNSFAPIGSFNLRNNLRHTRDSLGGHKLYQNNAGKFTDISQKAGILGSIIAFGLGVTVGDIDLDGWDDIYVSNDFFERDYLYHNNGDGTFSEDLEKSMRHISAASMGADMADLNNDNWPDIFVTDMLPQPDYRLKTTTTFESWDKFQYAKRSGYWNQFTQNMLQLSNGDPQPGGSPTFSEIARLAGCGATDWSWGATIFDFDNDGRKDLFVANGIAQDLTNLDYINFVSDPRIQQEVTANKTVDFKRLIDSIPSEAQPNYFFKNSAEKSGHAVVFDDKTAEWGLKIPSFSNGSAYGDLDNDGDLDLVVNNVNSEAFLYRNNTRSLSSPPPGGPGGAWLRFELVGEGQNTAAFGTKITIRHAGQTFFLEQMPVRGFESSVDPRPLFGVGEAQKVDSVFIEFPNGKTTLLLNQPTNQSLKILEKEATGKPFQKSWLARPKPLFENVTASLSTSWKHTENGFVDWDRDKLLYFMRSAEGPRLAVGDINGDRQDDFFVCGAAGQAGKIFVSSGKIFQETTQPALEKDKASEDVAAAFFDADGDRDLDLYVASGGNEFQPNDPELADRLYLNDGRGHFSRNENALPPTKPFASGCVAPADFDGDGDQDVFVGMRLMPGQYGLPVSSFLLENDGRGAFRPSNQPVFRDLGMLTDAVWIDLDGDKKLELVVVGEWLPVSVFKFEKGSFVNATARFGLEKTTGLWNRLAVGDFNGDGRPDLAAGNHGWNSRLQVIPARSADGENQPVTMWFNDFDRNGTPEQILCRSNGGRSLPFVLRHDLVGQMPFLKKKYLAFKNYQNQAVSDIFDKKQLEGAIEMKAEQLASCVFLSSKTGVFQMVELPIEAQFSSIYGLETGDFDGDGRLDLLSGGNFTRCKPEMGTFDADYGLFLKGDGRGNFQAVRHPASGFRLDGEVRDIRRVGSKILVARNDAGLLVFQKK